MEASKELEGLLIQDVVAAFPDAERVLLYNLSPFLSFTEEMARMVTGRADAPKLMREIAQKSYMLLDEKNGSYAFVAFVRNALFNEMKNSYTDDYIRNQYRRAALYHELQGDATEAVWIYMLLGDTEKIKELLIRDTQLRPSNGEYVDLKPAYDMLPREAILSSPELMKGMCMIESLRGHVSESDHWYDVLRAYIDKTPVTDANRRIAQEAVAYLDIALSHRGTGNILKTLVSTAKLGLFTDSRSWRGGFNVAGNSVSLMNGGKDFSAGIPTAGPSTGCSEHRWSWPWGVVAAAWRTLPSASACWNPASTATMPRRGAWSARACPAPPTILRCTARRRAYRPASSWPKATWLPDRTC